MADPCRPYRQLARNALLANRRLHLACAMLRPGEWSAARVSFFPSIEATLNHILVVGWFYVDALQGGTLGYAAFEDEVPCRAVGDLAVAQQKLDAEVLAFCEGLTAAGLQAEVRIHRTGRVQVETVADTLMHLFLHDQHHRGQVHAMLAGTSVRPPQLDEFFMADDRAARVGDLAALGKDEDWIMR
jgi:uncharacterized damage-inducible protein DinB